MLEFIRLEQQSAAQKKEGADAGAGQKEGRAGGQVGLMPELLTH